MIFSKSKSTIKNYTITALVVIAYSVCSYAQQVPLRIGEQQSSSIFYEKQASEVSEGFRIPIYNRKNHENKAVSWSKESEKAAAKNRKAKSKSKLRLEAKLKKLKIIPIPKYKFGKEKLISRKKIYWDSKKYTSVGSYSFKAKKIKSFLDRIFKFTQVEIKPAAKKNLNLKSPNPKVVLSSDADEVQFAPEILKDVQVLDLHLKEPQDLDLLTMDILFQEKESCEETIPLTEYLKDKKTKDFRVSYYRGMCLHKNKMYTESIPLLAKTIGKSTEYYAMKAVSEILRDLPKGYETIIAEGLAPKNVYNKLKQKQKDRYNYILAKGYFINEKYKRSEAHAKLVSKEGDDHYHGRLLLSTAQYMQGKIPQALKTLSKLKKDYFKKYKAPDEFKSLIHITLARFFFDRGSYDESIKEYTKVARSHPLWVDSLLEKGWAQLQTADYKGAIGNMHTLKSPFFKDAFIPEAQVIQTIGYLNICQFSYADDNLSYLEATYPQQKQRILNYIKSKKSYYETLTSYISQDTSKIYEYRGLPTSIVREMGRDREYLETQQKLNNIVDEIPRFNLFAQKLVQKARDLSAELVALTKESKDLRLKENEALQEKRVKDAKALKKKRLSVYQKGISVNYRITTFNKGILSFRDANKNAIDRAANLRDKYLAQAEKNLRQSMIDIDSRIDVVLRNNDLLRYEVYANSGKNIRYRAAGGEVEDENLDETTDERLPASVVAEKDYGWSFKGEYWEDEIGNFRSALKNLCPKKGK